MVALRRGSAVTPSSSNSEPVPFASLRHGESHWVSGFCSSLLSFVVRVGQDPPDRMNTGIVSGSCDLVGAAALVGTAG